MFLGEFQHSLDAKGRVILPAEFRPSLAEGAVIGAFPGGCLAVYTTEGLRAACAACGAPLTVAYANVVRG